MASDRPISLRLPHTLIAQIDRRTTRSPVKGARAYGRADAIRGALNRYYEICRRHLVSLDLNRGELGVLCAIYNGGLLGIPGDDNTEVLSTAIWARVAEVFRLSPGYGARLGISDAQGAALVSKLRRARYADLIAVMDLIERFWTGDPEAEMLVRGAYGVPAEAAGEDGGEVPIEVVEVEAVEVEGESVKASKTAQNTIFNEISVEAVEVETVEVETVKVETVEVETVEVETVKGETVEGETVEVEAVSLVSNKHVAVSGPVEISDMHVEAEI